MNAVKRVADKLNLTIHYLHDEAQQPHYNGRTALCDHRAGRDTEPRSITVSSGTRGDVTCPDCLTDLKEL